MKRPKQHTSQPSVVAPKWHGTDITTVIAPYADTPNVFHRLNMGRIGVAVYLLRPANFGCILLEHRPEFHHNTLEVYNLRVGEDGIHVGYLFRSPLRVVCDPYYVMFLRRGMNPINDIIKHPVSVEKRYTLDNLVFHTHDVGYMITHVEDNSISVMLDQ